MTCFACDSGPNRNGETRYLCDSHVDQCQLADGTSLSAALEAAGPVGFPLEGSSLSFLYNPVFVPDARDRLVRGLTSFAAGGMAVIEARHAAETYFELWLNGRSEQRSILEAIRRSPASVCSIRALPCSAGEKRHVEGAASIWWYERNIADRHRKAGRWPTSFEELQEWLRPPVPDRMGPHEEAEFLIELRRCAEAARLHARG